MVFKQALWVILMHIKFENHSEPVSLSFLFPIIPTY